MLELAAALCDPELRRAEERLGSDALTHEVGDLLVGGILEISVAGWLAVLVQVSELLALGEVGTGIKLSLVSSDVQMFRSTWFFKCLGSVAFQYLLSFGIWSPRVSVAFTWFSPTQTPQLSKWFWGGRR